MSGRKRRKVGKGDTKRNKKLQEYRKIVEKKLLNKLRYYHGYMYEFRGLTAEEIIDKFVTEDRRKDFESTVRGKDARVLNNFFKIHHPNETGVSKEMKVSIVSSHFFGEKSDVEKRKEEEEIISADRKNINDSRYFTLCDVDVPRDVILVILSFLYYNYRMVNVIGSLNSDFYLAVLCSFDTVVIKSDNVYKISSLILENVKNIVFGKCVKKEIVKVLESANLSNLNSLDFRDRPRLDKPSVKQIDVTLRLLNEMRKKGKGNKIQKLMFPENYGGRYYGKKCDDGFSSTFPNLRKLINGTSLSLNDCKKLRDVAIEYHEDSDYDIQNLHYLPQCVTSLKIKDFQSHETIKNYLSQFPKLEVLYFKVSFYIFHFHERDNNSDLSFDYLNSLTNLHTLSLCGPIKGLFTPSKLRSSKIKFPSEILKNLRSLTVSGFGFHSYMELLSYPSFHSLEKLKLVVRLGNEKKNDGMEIFEKFIREGVLEKVEEVEICFQTVHYKSLDNDISMKIKPSKRNKFGLCLSKKRRRDIILHYFSLSTYDVPDFMKLIWKKMKDFVFNEKELFDRFQWETYQYNSNRFSNNKEAEELENLKFHKDSLTGVPEKFGQSVFERDVFVFCRKWRYCNVWRFTRKL